MSPGITSPKEVMFLGELTSAKVYMLTINL